MRRFGQGCALLLLSFAASGQQTVGPLIERIEVNIVNVDVSVTDRAGHPIGGLTRDDFEVYEDGRPQKIQQRIDRSVVNEAKSRKLLPACAQHPQLLIDAAQLRHFEILRFAKQHSWYDQPVGARPQIRERRVARIA